MIVLGSGRNVSFTFIEKNNSWLNEILHFRFWYMLTLLLIKCYLSYISFAFSGIACIAFLFVDALSQPVQIAAHERSENSSLSLHPENFEELTSVVKVEDIETSHDPGKNNICTGEVTAWFR